MKGQTFQDIVYLNKIMIKSIPISSVLAYRFPIPAPVVSTLYETPRRRKSISNRQQKNTLINVCTNIDSVPNYFT